MTPEREGFAGYDPTEATIAACDGPEVEADDYQPFAGVDHGKLERAMDMLPVLEADLIYMRYTLQKRQDDLAVIMGITQAGVSYRLERAVERLKYLVDRPEVTEHELRRDLADFFAQQLDVDILISVWKTGCHLDTSKELMLTQGRVHHRYAKATAKLVEAAKTNPRWRVYAKLFGMWKPNMLKETPSRWQQHRQDPKIQTRPKDRIGYSRI